MAILFELLSIQWNLYGDTMVLSLQDSFHET